MSFKERDLKEVLTRRGTGTLLYGFSGSGKTSSIRSLPRDKTMILSCEEWGLRPLSLHFGWEKAIVAIVETHEQFEQILSEMVQARPEYLVVDSITRYYDLVEVWWEKKSGKKREEGGKLFLDRLGFCKAIVERQLDHVVDAIQHGTNVILLAHQKDAWGEDSVIALPGQLQENFMRCMDLVIRCRKSEDEKGAPTWDIECPRGDSAGKDTFGLSWPKPNDLKLIIDEARAKLACNHPLIAGGGGSTPPPVSPSPPPVVHETLTSRSVTAAAPSPPRAKEVETVTLPAPSKAAKPKPPEDTAEAYRDLVAIAQKGGMDEGQVRGMLVLKTGKEVTPWPLQVLVEVRSVIEDLLGLKPKRPRRQRSAEEGTAGLLVPLDDGSNVPF